MLVETKSSLLRDRIKVLTSALGLKVEDECLITAKKDVGLILEGFMNGTYLKCTIEAEVHQEGEVAIKPAYLKALKLGSTVTLKLNKSWLDFKSGKFQGHVETSQDIERFKSSRPLEVIPTPYNLACEDFVACMKRAFLQPTIVGQPYGIRCQLYGDEKDITVPVTLAISSIESSVRAALVKKQLPNYVARLPEETHNFMDVMLPPIVWSIVNKIKGPIQIGTDGKAFRLFSTTFDLHQPLLGLTPQDIDGWLQQLPKKNAGILEAEVPTLLEGINQATSVVVTIGSAAQEVTLNCVAKDDNLTIDVSASSGEATSHIPLEQCPKKELSLRLGARHITESLGLLGGGSVEVTVWSKPSAVLVYSGPKKEDIDNETDPQKKAALMGEIQTSYIIPQIAQDS